MLGASVGRNLQRALAAAGVGAAILAGWACTRPTPTSYSQQGTGVTPGDYADSRLCANCHSTIAANFRKTGMGRSFSRLPAEGTLEDFTPGKPFFHKASDTYFAMVRRGGEYWQRRWQTGFDGKETNVEEKRVDYVMGSGNHSRTYLHLTSRNTLQQLPLHWYAERGGYWAMSPGYDRPDHAGSTRAVPYECMFCHNAYPKAPPGHQEVGAERVFLQPLPEGIDCQRCHGPGKRHVELASAGGTATEKLRAAIVNPRRLPAERSLEICLQCHLETSSRKLPASLRRVERAPYSFIPGQALGDFRLSFDRTAGKNEGFENTASAYRLRKSLCFQRSQGRLQCTSCHDPHNVPRGQAASVQYNEVCAACHRPDLERLAVLATHRAGADCVACHMPKRRTDDEVHVVMTDHNISRFRPAGNLLAERPETHETPATRYRGEVVLYYPERLPETAENSLHLAVAQVRDHSNLDGGLPRLADLIEKHRPSNAGYYADLAEGYLASGDVAKAVRYFEEAVRRSPAPAFLLVKLGNALIESRQWAKAEEALRRATAAAPDDALAWGRLGWALWQQDKTSAAKAAMERGIALDPELPELHNDLAALLGGTGDSGAAEKELRAAIRILPGVAEWHLNLARLLATRGEVAESRHQFARAVRLKPEDAVARLDYARLLAAMKHNAEAEAQAKAAVEVDFGASPPHRFLGSLLAARGDLSGAARELETAVRLQPDLWEGHLDLAMVLGRQGATAAAIRHLKIAAGGSDTETKTAAKELLRKLGQ